MSAFPFYNLISEYAIAKEQGTISGKQKRLYSYTFKDKHYISLEANFKICFPIVYAKPIYSALELPTELHLEVLGTHKALMLVQATISLL